jgi:hypothetical protein
VFPSHHLQHLPTEPVMPQSLTTITIHQECGITQRALCSSYMEQRVATGA